MSSAELNMFVSYCLLLIFKGRFFIQLLLRTDALFAPLITRPNSDRIHFQQHYHLSFHSCSHSCSWLLLEPAKIDTQQFILITQEDIFQNILNASFTRIICFLIFISRLETRLLFVRCTSCILCASWK